MRGIDDFLGELVKYRRHVMKGLGDFWAFGGEEKLKSSLSEIKGDRYHYTLLYCCGITKISRSKDVVESVRTCHPAS